MKVAIKLKHVWCERAGLHVIDDGWLLRKLVKNFSASGLPNNRTKRIVTGKEKENRIQVTMNRNLSETIK